MTRESENDGLVTSTIIIAEDDRAARDSVVRVLGYEGYRVVAVSNGEDALNKIDDDAPDLLILDLMMPKVDGVEVLRRRKDRSLATRTRVLVLTAKTDSRDAVWCWELGADEYLTKPVDPERLAREVRLLLARTPSELRHRRDVGLADARERDRIERAFG